MKRPDVIVLDGSQRTALACVRSLGRRGLRVVVADSEPFPLAASSRYAAESVVNPDPVLHQADFEKWLHELGKRWPGMVVLPVTDVTVPPCLRARDSGADIRTAMPSAMAYSRVIDKYWISENAKKWGLLTPETKSIKYGNALPESFPVSVFPLVVKPRQSAINANGEMVRRAVSYAHDRDDLAQKTSNILRVEGEEALVQQYLQGEGFGIFVIFDKGRQIRSFAHRRLREKPPTGGVSVLSVSEPVDLDLEAKIRTMFEDLSWHGVAMVEFKRDGRGNSWLIEINARLWGSVQLAVDSGVDFPSLLYDLAMGQPLEGNSSYKTGKKLRWFLGDLDSLYLVLRNRNASIGAKIRKTMEFLLPWAPGMKYEHLRLDDPAPAWSATTKYLRKTFLK